ncbi:MAG TPA: hypothetical protein VFC93_16695 [Chloroflexota bacterium]|nr:hypothetical protein [Chloroflexota bacterium]
MPVVVGWGVGVVVGGGVGVPVAVGWGVKVVVGGAVDVAVAVARGVGVVVGGAVVGVPVAVGCGFVPVAVGDGVEVRRPGLCSTPIAGKLKCVPDSAACAPGASRITVSKNVRTNSVVFVTGVRLL